MRDNVSFIMSRLFARRIFLGACYEYYRFPDAYIHPAHWHHFTL
jgi:hypothetical protein